LLCKKTAKEKCEEIANLEGGHLSARTMSAFNLRRQFASSKRVESDAREVDADYRQRK
jgi:hypothetical protein